MHTRRLAVWAIVTALTLFLVACGDDDRGGTTTQAPTTTQAVTTTEGATTTGASAGAPAIPEDHEGRTQCLGCHAQGAGGAPSVPAVPDHSTLTDDRAVCASCHAEE